MNHEYRYFIARGKSLEFAQHIHQERREARATLDELLREVGAIEAYGQPRIVGLEFPPDKPKPDGWKSYARDMSKALMPDKRRKDLSEIRKRIEAIMFPGSVELHRRLGFDWCITNEEARRGSGNVILFTSAETIGDQVILAVPVDHNGKHGTPVDAEPIKTSEYWRLKEERAQNGGGRVMPAPEEAA